MTVDKALTVLEKYLDDALLAGLDLVRVSTEKERARFAK